MGLRHWTCEQRSGALFPGVLYVEVSGKLFITMHILFSYDGYLVDQNLYLCDSS